MKRWLTVIIVSFVSLLFVNSANALMIGYGTNSVNDNLINDNGSGDSASSTTGLIGFFGSVGNWNIITGTGVNSQAIYSSNFGLDLNSITINSTEAGTIYIGISEIGVSNTLPYHFYAGGTTDGTVEISLLEDGSNVYFANNVIANSGTLGGNVFGFDRYVNSDGIDTPHSVSMIVKISHTKPGSTSFNIVASVPEPSTALLMGLALLGLFAVGRKKLLN